MPRHHPTFPFLIIQKSKHENLNYLVQNEEERNAVGVKIVKYWAEAGYFQVWPVAPNLDESLVKKTGLSLKEINDIVGNPSLKNIQMKLGNYYETNTPEKLMAKLTKEYNHEVNHNKNCIHAKNAVDNKDGTMAWKIIDAYEGGEYQRVEEIKFDNT